MSDPRCDLLELVGEGYSVSRKCTLHIYGIAMTSYCAPPLSHQRLQNRRLICRAAQFHYMEKIVNWFPDLGKPSIKTIEFSEKKKYRIVTPHPPLALFLRKKYEIDGQR